MSSDPTERSSHTRARYSVIVDNNQGDYKAYISPTSLDRLGRGSSPGEASLDRSRAQADEDRAMREAATTALNAVKQLRADWAQPNPSETARIATEQLRLKANTKYSSCDATAEWKEIANAAVLQSMKRCAYDHSMCGKFEESAVEFKGPTVGRTVPTVPLLAMIDGFISRQSTTGMSPSVVAVEMRAAAEEALRGMKLQDKLAELQRKMRDMERCAPSLKRRCPAWLIRTLPSSHIVSTV